MTHFSKTKYAILTGAILMLGAPQAASAQSSAPLSGLYACETLSDSKAQLSCFLSETAKLRAAETSGDVIAVEKESFEEIKKSEVEKAVEKAVEEKANPPKSQTFAIQSTKTYGRSGYVSFTLGNGEVWRQTEPGRFRLGRAEPDMLTLKRTSFGGHLARVNDKAPSVRVKQVK